MNLSDLSEPLIEGQRIPADDIAPQADIVTGMVELVGMTLHKDIALIIVAAGCFFIGVVISCMMPEVSRDHRRKTLLSAPLSFFLLAPLWFTLLSGDLITTSIAPIDSFLAFAMDDGGVRAQMFAFGLVMMMGVLAAPILSTITGIVHRVMAMLGQKATPAAPSPPDGAG